MIISCPNCSTRMQLDAAKVPARAFTVRCPKCQHIINAQPAAAPDEGSAVAAGGDLPTTTRAQRETNGAPATDITLTPEEAISGEWRGEPSVEPSVAEAARLLIELLGRGAAATTGPPADRADGARRRPAWDKHRALVCVSTSHRQEVARDLAREGYEVTQAGGTAQAIERMRGDKLDVLVLDNEFDMAEQGAAFLTREINSLRPSERRRLIVVHLSQSGRTEDAHAAFLANANLIVNTGEVTELPRALERTVRDLNELYKNYNRALGAAEL
ncbi:MAG TPA: zinc-ribbon domain-containing protein [Pyrinomonadaceae bacterium]